jgi:hypothetical protein
MTIDIFHEKTSIMNLPIKKFIGVAEICNFFFFLDKSIMH